MVIAAPSIYLGAYLENSRRTEKTYGQVFAKVPESTNFKILYTFEIKKQQETDGPGQKDMEQLCSAELSKHRVLFITRHEIVENHQRHQRLRVLNFTNVFEFSKKKIEDGEIYGKVYTNL